MPVNDPFGPSVYVPATSTPGPARRPRAGPRGLSNLAKGLFPDPNALADARYKNTQTQLLNTQAAARSNLAGIFANPNAAADPNNRAQIYSWMTTLPADEQNAWHNNLAGVIQNVPSMTQAQRDQYIAGAGMVPAGNTPSGFNAQLQNQVNTTMDDRRQRASATWRASIKGAETYRWGNTPATSSGQGNAGLAGPVLTTPNRVNAAPPALTCRAIKIQPARRRSWVVVVPNKRSHQHRMGYRRRPRRHSLKQGLRVGQQQRPTPAPTNPDTPGGCSQYKPDGSGAEGSATDQSGQGRSRFRDRYQGRRGVRQAWVVWNLQQGRGCKRPRPVSPFARSESASCHKGEPVDAQPGDQRHVWQCRRRGQRSVERRHRTAAR